MKAAWKEFRLLLCGILICDGIMAVIAASLGKFDLSFILGMVLGSGYSLLSFILIGVAVENALKRDPRHAQIYMVTQYFLRYFLTAAVILVAILVEQINAIAAIIPLIFPKFVLYFSTIKNLKLLGGNKK